MTATSAARPAPIPRPEAAGTVTGTGTTGFLPIWNSTATLGNSLLSESGTNVGIGITTPIATLDVSGSINSRGSLTMLGQGATAAAGANSPSLQLGASSYSSATAAPVAQTFVWRAQPLGNNTAKPSANLALLFASAGAAPAATGLSIAPNGVITFAPAQTFPGTGGGSGTITGVTAGSGLTGGGTSGKVTLSLDATKAPLLGSANTFTANQTFTGSESFQNLVQIAVNTTPSAPAYPLDIEGGPASQPMAAIVTKGTDAALTLKNNGPGGREYWIDSGSKGAGVGAGNFAVWDAKLGARLVIDPAGEVGIGTVTPTGNQLAVVTSVDNAINATATNGWAGNFTNNSTTQATVNSTNTGLGNAGYFANNSPSRVALAGVNASTDLNAVATYGSVTNGKAVYGIATLGTGVYGTSTSGFGVEGNSSSKVGVWGQSSGADGVHGVSTGLQGVGVSGFSVNTVGVAGTAIATSTTAGIIKHNTGVGIWGDVGAPPSNASSLPFAILGTADDSPAGFFINNAHGATTIVINNLSDGSVTGFFRTLLASTRDGACGFGGAGTLTCTGQMKSIVATASARQVETYSVQSSENWLEDYGSGALEAGRAVVHLDPSFADMANTGVEYHVFLTPKGDAGSLYVTNETNSSFEVRESGRGTANIRFDYRIVAKRRGMEGQRMVDVTEKLRTELEAARPKLPQAATVAPPAPTVAP